MVYLHHPMRDAPHGDVPARYRDRRQKKQFRHFAKPLSDLPWVAYRFPSGSIYVPGVQGADVAQENQYAEQR
jgi:hypothetical protein